jgi:hypothetical protein
MVQDSLHLFSPPIIGEAGMGLKLYGLTKKYENIARTRN